MIGNVTAVTTALAIAPALTSNPMLSLTANVTPTKMELALLTTGLSLVTGSLTGHLGIKMTAIVDTEVAPSLETTTSETSEVAAIKVALAEFRSVAVVLSFRMSTTARRLPVLPLRQLSHILQ
jgi:hypothetical protein